MARLHGRVRMLPVSVPEHANIKNIDIEGWIPAHPRLKIKKTNLHREEPPMSSKHPTPKKKRDAAMWKIIFSIFMVALAFLALKAIPGLGLEKLPETFARFDPKWVLLGTAACLVQVSFQILRLGVVFPAKERPPFFRILNAVTFGQLLNGVAPMRSGDAYKVVALSRSDWKGALPVSAAASFMLAERVADNLMLFAAIGWAESALLGQTVDKVRSSISENGPVALAVAVVVGIGLFTAFRVFQKKLAALREKLIAFARHFSKLLVSPSFLVCVVVSLLTWILEAGSMAIMARGIGVDLSISQAISAIFMLNLGLAIPVTVANVGLFEASLAFGLSRFGVDPAVGVAVASLHHINQLVALGSWSAVTVLVQRRALRAR